LIPVDDAIENVGTVGQRLAVRPYTLIRREDCPGLTKEWLAFWVTSTKARSGSPGEWSVELRARREDSW